MPSAVRPPHARAFTLIELLVVIGILALLIAILLPVLSRARAQGQRASCLGQLHSLGQMFQLYLGDNHQRTMRLNSLPSDPTLLPYPAPSIVEVFAPYHRGATGVFRCPSDRLLHPGPTTRARGGASYFECEGTSYEYNVFFNAYALDPGTGLNRIWGDALADAKKRRPLMLAAPNLPLLVDFEGFHGKPELSQSHNALYADFHAAPLDLGLPAAP